MVTSSFAALRPDTGESLLPEIPGSLDLPVEDGPQQTRMRNNKPIVLTFVAHYLPGYKSGGPMRTIANMVEHLSDDLDFRIITADRDLMDAKPYPNVSIGKWNVVGKAKVFYASRANQALRSLTCLINETPHDVLYLNGFFPPVFTLRPLLARRFGLIPKRPTVIATRGEFSRKALAIRRWKKAPYRAIARALGLYRHLTWQASSEYEAEEIRKGMGSTARRVVVAPNLPPRPDVPQTGAHQRIRVPGEPLRVCFLSRILPTKNLEFALKILDKTQIPVTFNIYGPIEDATYWRKCVVVIKELGKKVSVQYRGSIEPGRVGEVFGNSDLFFFPTERENFGHVILESMLAGTPVLLADTTPWRGLESLGVGWDLPLGAPDAFVAAILKAAKMGTTDYSEWRHRVRQYAFQKCYDTGVLESNKQLFLQIIDH